jgi:hypothetical protein
MKTAYLDAFSGLSGDMLVGALLDAGVDFEKLQHALASLPLKGSRLSSRRKTVSGIAAMKFDVEVMEAQPERHLAQIIAMIEASSIGAAARRRARAIFEVLADAEAKVHHTTPEQVHFHEVGAVDSIMDVVGTAWALEELGVGELLVSPRSSSPDSRCGWAMGRPRWSRLREPRCFARSDTRRQCRSISKSKRSATARAPASTRTGPTCCAS